MKIRQYQIDAFAAQVLEGNAPAVGSLKTWLDDREPLAAGAVAFIETDIAF
jgi:predicted PhzF superfamily epimerase YddE/YHI9